MQRLKSDGAYAIEFMDHNVGRGGVIKHLWGKCSGDVIVHQDADLEYDPGELERLLAPLVSGQADVVYGSRFKGRVEKMRWLNNLGNRVMTAACRLLYGIDITDLMTCYKMYRRQLIESLRIEADGFDFEAEFTTRLAQGGARFAEVPISFYGRTFEEGKKIRGYDAIRVLKQLVRCKLSRPHG
jgi:glycosyltransferase involved in cell wall biosynthesis